MKELSIEEKAKAYDDAIAKAKEQYNYPCMRSCMGILEEIFPELKESEDEKVRQKIQFLFYAWRNNEQVNIPNKKEVEKAIDWLEKQGDHYKFRNGIQIGDKVTRNEDGVLVNLSQLKRVAKPADKVEPKFKVGDKIFLKPEYRMPDDDTPIANTVKEIIRIDDKYYRFDGSYIFIEDQDKYELAEQKPEENNGNVGGISPNWSEEDEQYVEDTLALIGFGLSAHTIGEVQEWLKSLKDRVQPKQEWSEEDKYMYDILCGTIENTDINENTKYKLISWLKSLRPQNHWKPSDEQVDALTETVHNLWGSPETTLSGLLADLKKLKEE